jgi:hypothetical protein
MGIAMVGDSKLGLDIDEHWRVEANLRFMWGQP